MSVEEEREFLEPWAESAADGGMLIVAPLRAALAQRLGRPITHSAVYRLLARHGWRKVAPDTRHLESDPLTQEQWKKLSDVLEALVDPAEVRGRRVRLMFPDEARFGASVWPRHLESERRVQEACVHVTSLWTHGHFGFCRAPGTASTPAPWRGIQGPGHSSLPGFWRVSRVSSAGQWLERQHAQALGDRGWWAGWSCGRQPPGRRRRQRCGSSSSSRRPARVRSGANADPACRVSAVSG